MLARATSVRVGTSGHRGCSRHLEAYRPRAIGMGKIAGPKIDTTQHLCAVYDSTVSARSFDGVDAALERRETSATKRQTS